MNETTDATLIFGPIWKRKWLILFVGLLVAAGTYAYYKHQPSKYSVTTQLYLGAGAEEEGLLNGTGAKALAANSVNQTALINSVISEEVHKRLRETGNLAAARAKVRAKSAAEKSQFITITAEAHTPQAAALLANLTAQAYIKRQHANFSREIEKAVGIARRQLRRVEGSQRSSSSARTKGSAKGSAAGNSTSVALQAANLNGKVNQLEAELSIKGVQQVTPAKPEAAQLLSPKPRKNAIFGFFLGLILAAVAAYALARFDGRLRSLADVEAAFQTQILTALPTVRNTIVYGDGPPRTSRLLIEPLRRLHTTLQLSETLDQGRGGAPRSILFVSADRGDGKSTLIANLARIQRDAGERVAVIEADFRRPAQARLLDVKDTQGLAEVLDGTLTVHEAFQSVAPARQQAAGPPESGSGVSTVIETGVGTLSVLVSGGAVANPPAMLAGARMAELLSSVTEEFDYVLIDAPPPLEVSDVMPLLGIVDGLVVVTRVGHTRTASAQRLMQLLLRAPGTIVLGTVANAVPRRDIERYGFSSSAPARVLGRRKPAGR